MDTGIVDMPMHIWGPERIDCVLAHARIRDPH